jgi:DNA-binding GntR family transcriptional regulator
VTDDAAAIDRATTAERVAGLLRRRIIDGDLPPGTRLSEERLVKPLRVSRNTLREAFRLLSHEGLLVHELHHGVSVPRLGIEDVVDLYRLRRTLECAIVSTLTELSPEQLRPLHDDVAQALARAAAEDWLGVGTSNMHFHQHLVGLAGSRRLDEIATRLLAELRLAFHAIDNPRDLHQPFVARNARVLELLVDGDPVAAAAELEGYLRDSEAVVVAAMMARAGEAARVPAPVAGS